MEVSVLASVEGFVSAVDFFHVWEEFGEFDCFDSVVELEVEEDLFWASEGF